MTPESDALTVPEITSPGARRGFEKVILRLVKGGPERLAIEAGEIDAIVDRESGKAILLPEAQRALLERKQGFLSLVGLGSDWQWEQDEHYRFVARAGAAIDGFRLTDEALLGKALWELPIDNMSAADWRLHRQQLEWRARFRDLEIHFSGRDRAVRILSLSGEPVFDDRHQFKGYRGIARDITAQKQAEAASRFARVTLDALPTEVCVLDPAGVVLLANNAWRIAAGTPEGDNHLAACLAGDGIEELDGIAIAAGILQVIAKERGSFRYEYASGAPAGRRWHAIGVSGIPGDTVSGAVVSREDVTERKRGELLQELEHAVARCLADANDASTAMQAVIRTVCEAQGWDCGRYFRLDVAARVLRCEETWGVPVPAVAQFLEKSSSMVLRVGAGLKGRVCQSGQPLWVPGGAQNAGLSPTALAPETDATGAFVFPVISEGRTIGVLAFSSATVRQPDDRVLQTVRSIGSQLGRFLQRQQALDDLRRSETYFRRLTELSCDWYWELDREFRFTRFAGCSIPGAGDVIGKTYWDLPNVVVVPGQGEWAEHKAQLAAHWSLCDFEFAAVHPDGQLGYYCISGEPVFDERTGAFAGYCGTGLDITRRKRAEIALRESEARLRAASVS